VVLSIINGDLKGHAMVLSVINGNVRGHALVLSKSFFSHSLSVKLNVSVSIRLPDCINVTLICYIKGCLSDFKDTDKAWFDVIFEAVALPYNAKVKTRGLRSKMGKKKSYILAHSCPSQTGHNPEISLLLLPYTFNG
jgi:hypothetical protein